MEYKEAFLMLNQYVGEEKESCLAKYKVEFILNKVAFNRRIPLSQRGKYFSAADAMFRSLVLDRNASTAYAKEMYEAALVVIERV